MADGPTKSRFKPRRRAIGIVLVFLCALIPYAMLGRGVTPDQIGQLDRQHQAILNLHKKIAAERPQFPARDGAATAAALDGATTAAREADQARCDRLFREIYGPPERRRPDASLDARLAPARELAALYDSGARVSDDAKIGLCTWGNVFLSNALADRMIAEAGYRPELEQSREHILACTLPAAKFLRMADLPVLADNPALGRLQNILDPPYADPYMKTKPYPQALLELDPDLIAPRRPWYWRRQMPRYLEIASGQAGDLAGELATFQSVYRARRGIAPLKFLGAVRAMPLRRHTMERQVRFVEELTAQADRIYEYPDLFLALPDQDDNTWKIGYWSAGQEKARLICAALEMLRGAAVPEHPGVDSYFYDIYTGGRIRIEQATTKGGDVRVTLGCGYPAGKPLPYKNLAVTFVVPPSHPALKGLK